VQQLDFKFTVPPATRQRLIHPCRLDAITRLWSARFRPHMPVAFQVRFTANTSTMISSRRRGRVLHLRLHHMFIDADDAVLTALAQYLKGMRQGNRRLDRFIERNMNRVARRKLSRSRGRRFDLLSIRDALSRAYFTAPVDVPVVWGPERKPGRQRSIRLGSYSFEDRIIRIHPILDRDQVPAYVVVGVVYHEMLHHVLGSERRKDRRLVHTREFREREAAFVHYQRAEAWERENLSRLLGRA
jgi:hypothetical protein